MYVSSSYWGTSSCVWSIASFLFLEFIKLLYIFLISTLNLSFISKHIASYKPTEENPININRIILDTINSSSNVPGIINPKITATTAFI